MSKGTVSLIMGRISSASPESQIAVFHDDGARLNAVFARTVLTKRRLDKCPPDLIGVFDNTMAPEKVKNYLQGFIRSQFERL